VNGPNNYEQSINKSDRKLDQYFQLEEELSKQSKAQVLDIIKDADKGKEPLDKLRLFLQW
jgi:sec1 family domain-containing protein 1